MVKPPPLPSLANCLLSGIRDPCVVVTRDGLITRLNPAAETFFHRDARQLVGRKMESLLPTRLRQPWLGYAEEAWKSSSEVHFSVTDCPPFQAAQINMSPSCEGLVIQIQRSEAPTSARWFDFLAPVPQRAGSISTECAVPDVLDALMNVLVPNLANSCVVYLLNEHNVLVPVRTRTANPCESDQSTAAYIDEEQIQVIWNAWQEENREPVERPSISVQQRPDAALPESSSKRNQMLRDDGVFLAVPLQVKGQNVGLLGVRRATAYESAGNMTQLILNLAELLVLVIPQRLVHEPSYWDVMLRPLAETGTMVVTDHGLSAEFISEQDMRHCIGGDPALAENLRERFEIQRRQLEEVTAELDAFSYSVSHDLRAPIRHVQGFAEMLRRVIADDLDHLDQRASRYLDVIGGSAKRANELIDDLLAFSRLGRQPLQYGTVDLSAELHEVLLELEAEHDGRDVVFLVESLPLVWGDRALLHVALKNVLSNALKFSRTRAQAVIEVRAEETADWSVIEVRDNGVGFNPDFHDKLFGMFQRLHRSEEFEGRGIGLALTRRIVVRHGGEIEATARPEGGAVFRIRLPKGSGTSALHSTERG